MARAASFRERHRQAIRPTRLAAPTPTITPAAISKRGAVRRRRPGPAWRVSPRARRNSAGARRGSSQGSVPVAVISASGSSPPRTRDDHGLTRSFAKWLGRASGKAAGQGHRGSARLESGLPASGTRTDSAWRVGRGLSRSDALVRVHRTGPAVRLRTARRVAKCAGGGKSRNAPIGSSVRLSILVLGPGLARRSTLCSVRCPSAQFGGFGCCGA
jgi:hypothetical protein